MKTHYTITKSKYKQYKVQSLGLKNLKRRYCKMNNKMSVILHYWKIRCEERKSLHKYRIMMSKTLVRIKRYEDALKILLNRKTFVFMNRNRFDSTSKAKMKLVYMSRGDSRRLRNFLHDRIVFPKKRKNKFLVHLTQNELCKLKRILKKDNRIRWAYK